MSDAKTITVWADYDHLQEDGSRDVGSEAFWAVKPPRERSGYVDLEGIYQEGRFLSYESYRIMGSFEVQVYDKNTIRGLRLLLDAIEKDMDE